MPLRKMPTVHYFCYFDVRHGHDDDDGRARHDDSHTYFSAITSIDFHYLPST